MAHSSSNDEDMITGINITPMVDVMLVLLVIFMVAAPTLYNGSIKVELPKVSSSEKNDKITLKFTLQTDGKIFLEKKEVTQAEIPALIQQAIAIDPKADALIAADQSLNHGTVIKFIDLIKTSGVKRFAISVDDLKSK